MNSVLLKLINKIIKCSNTVLLLIKQSGQVSGSMTMWKTSLDGYIIIYYYYIISAKLFALKSV